MGEAQDKLIALTRKVETPEGERKFHKPIGSLLGPGDILDGSTYAVFQGQRKGRGFESSVHSLPDGTFEHLVHQTHTIGKFRTDRERGLPYGTVGEALAAHNSVVAEKKQAGFTGFEAPAAAPPSVAEAQPARQPFVPESPEQRLVREAENKVRVAKFAEMSDRQRVEMQPGGVQAAVSSLYRHYDPDDTELGPFPADVQALFARHRSGKLTKADYELLAGHLAAKDWD